MVVHKNHKKQFFFFFFELLDECLADCGAHKHTHPHTLLGAAPRSKQLHGCACERHAAAAAAEVKRCDLSEETQHLAADASEVKAWHNKTKHATIRLETLLISPIRNLRRKMDFWRKLHESLETGELWPRVTPVQRLGLQLASLKSAFWSNGDKNYNY